MRISTNELLIVLLIVLVIFGPKQLPKLGKMFGKTMKSFKDGVNTEETEGEEASEDKADVAAEKPAEEKKTEDKAE